MKENTFKNKEERASFRAQHRFDRIGIIGAGPAGLSIAEALREAGYFNITVMEARDKAGGKSLSREHVAEDGTKTVYELGSIQPTGSKLFHKIIKRYGLHFKGPGELRGYSLEQNQVVMTRAKLFTQRPFRLIYELLQLAPYLIKYRRLNKPGFHGFKYIQELSCTGSNFIERFDFKVLKELLHLMVGAIGTAFVPSREAEQSAMYTIKILYGFMKRPWSYLDATAAPIREGYQEIWVRVAQTHKVIYNSPVMKLKRANNIVQVITKDGTEHEFDKLIITINPKLTKEFEGLSQEEERIFSKIIYSPGYRWAVEVEHAPTNFWYYITEANELEKEVPEGQMAFYFHCFPDQKRALNIFHGSLQTPHPVSEARIKEIVESFAQRFHSKVTKWLGIIYWKDYAAHFDCPDVKAGIYDDWDAMQGELNTYYAGEALACGLHAAQVDYGYDLVKRFF